MKTHRTLAALCLIGALPALANAGPLDPPAGPVQPTGKTLTEVEPRTPLTPDGNRIIISQPGSYYLTGDVTVAGQGGFLLLAGGITLDLNGFTVKGEGQPGGIVSSNGITVSSSAPGNNTAPIVIRNGRVEGFFDGGVINFQDEIDLIVEDLTVQAGNSGGIRTQGDGRIERCTVVGGFAVDTPSPAISLFGSGIVKDCVVKDTQGIGIRLISGVVSGCVVRDTSNDGIEVGSSETFDPPGEAVRVVDCVVERATMRGFDARSRASFEGCTATSCGEVGFWTENGSTLVNCASELNGADGFSLGTGNSITNCTARENGGNGIFVLARAIVTGCTADSNTLDGFSIGRDSNARDCTAIGNSANGFDAATGVNINDCVANTNTFDGFDLSSDGRITGSTADGNLVAGIDLGGTCVADSNHVTDNAVGIDGGTGSVIIRNTALDNTTNFSGSTSGLAPVVTSPASATNPLSNIAF